MSPLDEQLLQRKITAIRADLLELEKFSTLSKEEYIQKYELQLQIERILEKIIGRLIDINFHVLKEKYQLIAEDYYSSFVKIGEVGGAPSQLAMELAKAAGLRNILAHEYDQIDPVQVYSSIGQVLKTVPKYLQALNS